VRIDTRVVTAGPDLEEVRGLFREYAAWVAVDLSFQGFAEELAGLPGEYVAPAGTLLLCTVEGSAAGCVAVRPWGEGTCEMKRLYVRPAYQGRGCGLFLAERAIAWAAGGGYTRMVLDTLPVMAAAQRLYARLGFLDIAPYRFNPVPGARFMALDLRGPDGPSRPGARK
jgi:GNAT superfamily N-acetyltransferase